LSLRAKRMQDELLTDLRVPMKMCLSFEKVRELEGLSKSQRRFAIELYHRTIPVEKSTYKDLALVGAIFFCVIGGCLAGFFLWPKSNWGGALAGFCGLYFVLGAFCLVHLCIEVPKFRRFLRTDASQAMLRNFKLPEAAPSQTPPPPRKDVEEILAKYRASDGAPMREAGLLEALRGVGYDVANVSEGIELAGELLNQSIASSTAIKQKSREASQSLRSFKFGKWLRLGREIYALRTEACCLIRRGSEILADAQKKLGVAGAVLTELEKKSGQ